MRLTPLERARARAKRLYRSSGFQAAYVKGAGAALAGRSVDDCPYGRDPQKTWGAAWRRAWVRGYQSVAGDET